MCSEKLPASERFLRTNGEGCAEEDGTREKCTNRVVPFLR